MELYVHGLLPCFCLFIFTAWCASLVPCSLCLDASYEYCQTKGRTCGNMNITYPFGVGNRGCGLPKFQIICVQNSSPVIKIHDGYYTMEMFYYDSNQFVIFSNKSCQFLDDPINIDSDYADPVYKLATKTNWTLSVYVCNKSLQDPVAIEGEISQCNATVYYSSSFDKPPDGKSIPGCTIRSVLVEMAKMEWISNYSIRNGSCRSCETSGGICGYNISDPTSAAAPFVCYCKDGPRNDNCTHGHKSRLHAIVIGCVIGGVVLTTIAVFMFLMFYAKKRTGTSPSRVEKFLKENSYEMPTRYSHSHLKKITNNFAEKLGEGGFGVVYKGKLRKGSLVAVKLLDRHRHTQTQFMNEVATIGRVHHVNLVRLLGYCFENPISALVYEYMPNGSLDKFVFAQKEAEGQVLRWEQLYSIALGAARGISYLHHDCEKRIVHFDIKPHNILLDADFTPKIADFGLAKLCGKGDDHISITATRGTPGYVAPELCHSDAGPVTDKSDVYSFGMLLLEIVGGRKNIDVQVSRSSQFYFPEWACKLIERGELGMRLRGEEMECADEEKARRLTKVGLWCIQYNSANRPCMRRVVQLLEANGDDVANPPLPFNSSPTPENPLLHSTVDSSSMEITF